ncbi:MAG: DUF3667 domain-containing protein [Sphingomonadaceae bacterium]|nr:DUF3667 domain-containing protein [Sphingomonadaceae bacterium]
MNGLGDGIGTVIEGGLIGRAVEPDAGDGANDTRAGSGACANCGAAVHSKFCAECGQKAHLHRSLAAIGHDIMHGVLHLDGKLWNTLPLLAFKPGQLTRRYVEGERAKFVSPMAMFLFSVFAMFAVFQMVGVTAPTDFGRGVVDGINGTTPIQPELQQQITTLEKERSGLAPGDQRRSEIDNELKALNGVLQATSGPGGGVSSADFKVTGIGFLDDGIIQKWKSNPSLMLYKLQTNAYKFSWLLIPLSIPFVWLIFAWRRQYKAYDHAVFVTYSLAFMSLLFIVMSLLGVAPGGWGGPVAVGLLTIGAPLHIYKQLRHAYGLTRFSALWRFFALLFFINVVIVLFLQTLLVLGAF